MPLLGSSSIGRESSDAEDGRHTFPINEPHACVVFPPLQSPLIVGLEGIVTTCGCATIELRTFPVIVETLTAFYFSPPPDIDLTSVRGMNYGCMDGEPSCVRVAKKCSDHVNLHHVTQNR